MCKEKRWEYVLKREDGIQKLAFCEASKSHEEHPERRTIVLKHKTNLNLINVDVPFTRMAF